MWSAQRLFAAIASFAITFYFAFAFFTAAGTDIHTMAFIPLTAAGRVVGRASS